MKLKNFLISLTVIISSLFITTVKAAAPSSYDLIRDTSNIINYNEDIVKVEGSTHALYFPLKYSANGNYLVFCSGDRSANTENSKFTKTSFVRDYDGAMVAAIIKAGVGENATKNVSQSDIFFTQIAIWKALAPNAGNPFSATEAALSSSQRALFNSLLAAGSAAKSRYEIIKNFAISIDATKLNFTLNGDVYESQVIKVLGDEIKTKTLSVNKGTVVEKDGGYVVRIEKSQLSEGKNTITLKANATSNTIEIASNYTNGKSGQQTTTITVFDYYSKTAEASIVGEINIEPNTVSISKVDATTGKELPGATLVLKDSSGNEVDKWVSTNTPHIVKNLKPGKYTLTETIAPEGYKLSTETVEFTVEKDGTVKNPPVMKNYPDTYVEISKVDATNGEELPGATLVLKNENGKVVETWISGNVPHKIKNLAPGKYTLTETIAPEGYILSTDTVEFTVEKDGTVKEPVVMKNYPEEPKTVYISKQDITTGKELPGAYLEIKNEKGEVVEAWISSDEPHKVMGLEPGKYTLTETIAPDGYELSKETVEFTVKEDGTVDGMVIMYNKPEEVEVPSTASFKTITASLIGLIIIGFGSMMIYKNYKKNEEN